MIEAMQPQRREKPRGRALCEHPYTVHILHIRNRPAAEHDNHIPLRSRWYIVCPLKVSHQPIGNRSDGEQIQRKRKGGEQPRRTVLMPFFPKIDGKPNHCENKNPRRQNPCRTEFQNIDHKKGKYASIANI